MTEKYSTEQIDIKNELKKTEECQAILSNTIIGLYARSDDLNNMLQRADSLTHTAFALSESTSNANLIRKNFCLEYIIKNFLFVISFNVTLYFREF